jgi:short subunit fatty acids transporter
LLAVSVSLLDSRFFLLRVLAWLKPKIFVRCFDDAADVIRCVLVDLVFVAIVSSRRNFQYPT